MKRNVERRRRENRGAKGAEGVGSGEGIPPFPVAEGIQFFDFFCLAMVHFGAFWPLVLMLV